LLDLKQQYEVMRSKQDKMTEIIDALVQSKRFEELVEKLDQRYSSLTSAMKDLSEQIKALEKDDDEKEKWVNWMEKDEFESFSKPKDTLKPTVIGMDFFNEHLKWFGPTMMVIIFLIAVCSIALTILFVKKCCGNKKRVSDNIELTKIESDKNVKEVESERKRNYKLDKPKKKDEAKEKKKKGIEKSTNVTPLPPPPPPPPTPEHHSSIKSVPAPPVLPIQHQASTKPINRPAPKKIERGQTQDNIKDLITSHPLQNKKRNLDYLP